MSAQISLATNTQARQAPSPQAHPVRASRAHWPQGRRPFPEATSIPPAGRPQVGLRTAVRPWAE